MTDDLADRLRACEAALTARSLMAAELLSILAREREAAQNVVAAWDRLCDCIEEFQDYDLEAMACGELQQQLDEAIAGLKGLITDGQDHERLEE